MIAWILGIATLIGGIAAIGYFVDKWRAKAEWIEKDKEVNSAWWESSDLRTQYQEAGCGDFGWSNPERVAERLAAGKEAVYKIDEKSRIKYRLVNRSGQVLLCRRGA